MEPEYKRWLVANMPPALYQEMVEDRGLASRYRDDKISELERLHGVEQNRAELLAKDLDSVHRWLDDLRVPRADEHARVYSIIGRVKVLVDHHRGEVCLCGCPMEDHDQYEEGMSCGHDDHQCYLVWPAVQQLYLEARRDAPLGQGALEVIRRHVGVQGDETTLDAIKRVVGQYRRALAFAVSVIKSGEQWSETCEQEIGPLL